MIYYIVTALSIPIVFLTIRARWRAIRASKRSPEVARRYRTMILKQKD